MGLSDYIWIGIVHGNGNFSMDFRDSVVWLEILYFRFRPEILLHSKNLGSWCVSYFKGIYHGTMNRFCFEKERGFLQQTPLHWLQGQIWPWVQSTHRKVYHPPPPYYQLLRSIHTDCSHFCRWNSRIETCIKVVRWFLMNDAQVFNNFNFF